MFFFKKSVSCISNTQLTEVHRSPWSAGFNVSVGLCNPLEQDLYTKYGAHWFCDISNSCESRGMDTAEFSATLPAIEAIVPFLLIVYFDREELATNLK